MNESASVADPPHRSRGCPPGGGSIVPAHGGQIGNPPHVRTDANAKRIREMARAGADSDACARAIGVHPTTMWKHYSAEWHGGRDEAKLGIGAGVVKRALEGSVPDAHFYLRTVGGWVAPPQHLVHTGPGGGPIATINLTAVLSGMSDDDLAAAERIFAAIVGSRPDDGSGDSLGGPPADP